MASRNRAAASSLCSSLCISRRRSIRIKHRHPAFREAVVDGLEMRNKLGALLVRESQLFLQSHQLCGFAVKSPHSRVDDLHVLACLLLASSFRKRCADGNGVAEERGEARCCCWYHNPKNWRGTASALGKDAWVLQRERQVPLVSLHNRLHRIA